MFYYKDIVDFLMEPVLDSVGCPGGVSLSQLSAEARRTEKCA